MDSGGVEWEGKQLLRRRNGKLLLPVGFSEDSIVRYQRRIVAGMSYNITCTRTIISSGAEEKEDDDGDDSISFIRSESCDE